MFNDINDLIDCTYNQCKISLDTKRSITIIGIAGSFSAAQDEVEPATGYKFWCQYHGASPDWTSSGLVTVHLRTGTSVAILRPTAH
jgi:hypothetical protein